MLPLYFTLAAVFGYLLGSIPFGLVITKAAGLGDIRAIGSGNIGATNVLRTGRKDLALATLLLDAGKAGIALLIARWLSEGLPQQTLIELTAGTAAFVGHCFPIWLKFKGGKGLATFFGLLFAGYWPLAMLAGATWLAIATIFRYSSLAGLITAAITPIAALVAGLPEHAAFTALLAALIFWRHRGNIERLVAGAEPRIGDKKAAAAEEAPSEPAATPAPAPVIVEPTAEPEPVAPTLPVAEAAPELAPVIEEVASEPEPIAFAPPEPEPAPPEPTPVDPTPAGSPTMIEDVAPEPEPIAHAAPEPEPVAPALAEATPEPATPAEPKPEA